MIVQGDTESAFQGALTAFYNGVAIAHVEAGLRTYDLKRPFPEEGTRQMIARLARFHFAPTTRASAALIAEGVSPAQIQITGNTVVDAQQWACKHRGVKRQVNGRGHLLVTVHRRENWGADLTEICLAISDIATLNPDLKVLFPVHLNPAILAPVHALLGSLRNIQLIAPLDYVGMQQALADAWMVLTDSGGLQEEAPTFGIPVLVLREETERPEAVEARCARVIGCKRSAIVHEVMRLNADPIAFSQMQKSGNPFGDGEAALRITRTLAAFFDIEHRRVSAQALTADLQYA